MKDLPAPVPVLEEKSNEIRYWNRRTSKLESENVYGEKWVRWLYLTYSGRQVTERLLTRHLVSWMVGKFQSSRLSRPRVSTFIQEYPIPMEEYDEGPFSSFND